MRNHVGSYGGSNNALCQSDEEYAEVLLACALAYTDEPMEAGITERIWSLEELIAAEILRVILSIRVFNFLQVLIKRCLNQLFLMLRIVLVIYSSFLE